MRYSRDVVACVVATRAYAWVCSIAVEAATDLLEQAHEFAVEWVARAQVRVLFCLA